jgi:CheY-like chemotaxis protein
MATILIIDDEEMIRRTLRLGLEMAGHQVWDAGDGAEGLRLLRRHEVDLVCCDLFMPGQEGLETIRQLRAEFPEVKVVAMSGGGFNGTLGLLSVAQKLGATRLLPKPFTLGRALAVIQEALGGLIECGVSTR